MAKKERAPSCRLVAAWVSVASTASAPAQRPQVQCRDERSTSSKGALVYYCDRTALQICSSAGGQPPGLPVSTFVAVSQTRPCLFTFAFVAVNSSAFTSGRKRIQCWVWMTHVLFYKWECQNNSPAFWSPKQNNSQAHTRCSIFSFITSEHWYLRRNSIGSLHSQNRSATKSKLR